MSDDAQLKDLYAHTGPFATAYLDASRITENGAHEVELRWRALRSQLADAGAGEAELAALDGAVDDDQGTAGTHGLVVVAAEGQVVFRAQLPRPPLREIAAVAPLPYLMPYLAQRGQRVPHLVIVADRTGADISMADDPDTPATAGSETVQGGTQHPLHRTGRDQWDESHFQHRVENAWDANARDVGDVVVKLVKERSVQAVLLAGEERAITFLDTYLHKQLTPTVEIVKIGEGGRAAGASEESLQDAVRSEVLRQRWRQRRTLLAHLQQNLGREEYAVAGVAGVLDAVRRSAADTVVISDDPSSTLKAWIGPEPVHLGLDRSELEIMGVDDPQEDRFDSALLRAIVGTGSALVTTPNAHDYLPEGIGALLRY